MSNAIENMYVGPLIGLMVVGILITSALFYFMFKFADEGNLVMVIVIPLIVSLVAFIIAKCMVPKKRD